MSLVFPSQGITRKFKSTVSTADTALTSTITVPSNHYGIIWKLWVDLAVASEAMLEVLPVIMTPTVTIGSVVWARSIHPYIARTGDDVNDTDHKDLGPWEFDFGIDGLYSGVLGENIVVTLGAAGANVATRVNYIYAGD